MSLWIVETLGGHVLWATPRGAGPQSRLAGTACLLCAARGVPFRYEGGLESHEPWARPRRAALRAADPHDLP